jgi:succinylarginine dihydrolase
MEYSAWRCSPSEECRQRENVWRYLTALAADSASPIDEVAAFDLRLPSALLSNWLLNR